MKFSNPIAQELFELMNCFESNVKTNTRLVGDGEDLFLLMVKDGEVHSISDAMLDEKQIISMTNYIAAFQMKLTKYSTEMMRRGLF